MCVHECLNVRVCVCVCERILANNYVIHFRNEIKVLVFVYT